jgi:hypothetical protein
MVPVRMWQWQYWQSCGSVYTAHIFFLKKLQWRMAMRIMDGKGWQWLGGSGGSRFVRSRRFEWYRLGCGSGSIGRVVVVFIQPIFFFEKIAVANGNAYNGWQGVAVVGWQWWHSIREVKAVRMVPVRMWQWQYWQSCGSV